MIARTWSGRVPHRHADRFAAHLADTGVADCLALPGCAGAEILRADHAAHVEFRLVTYWESAEAIRAFAGDRPDVSVLYPGDEAYELDPDSHVTHHQVVSAPGSDTR